jgi:hypothetical protein
LGVRGDQKNPRKTKPYVLSKLAAYSLKKLKPSEKAIIEAVVVTTSKRLFGLHNWHGMVGSRSRRTTPIITRRKPPVMRSSTITNRALLSRNNTSVCAWITQSADSRRDKSRTNESSRSPQTSHVSPSNRTAYCSIKLQKALETQHLHKRIA